jgi:hypothetical protein
MCKQENWGIVWKPEITSYIHGSVHVSTGNYLRHLDSSDPSRQSTFWSQTLSISMHSSLQQWYCVLRQALELSATIEKLVRIRFQIISCDKTNNLWHKKFHLHPCRETFVKKSAVKQSCLSARSPGLDTFLRKSYFNEMEFLKIKVLIWYM